MNKSLQDLLESVPCPVCESDQYTEVVPSCYPDNMNSEELISMYHSSSDDILMDALVKCDNCGVHYLNPRVKEDIILEGYKSADDPVFFSQNPQRIRTFKRQLKKLMEDHQISVTSDTRVLDIGCAGGAFPKAATDLGMKATGIEPSQWLCERGKELYGLDLRAGTLSDHKFKSETFDIITLWDVIEHLANPKEMLEEVSRLLKPDGIFVINYPDYDSYAHRILGSRWPFFLSVHLVYFSPKTIERLLNTNGFTVDSIRPFWQTLELGYILKRAGFYFKPLNWLSDITRLFGMSKLPFTYNLGQTMVVARKKKELADEKV